MPATSEPGEATDRPGIPDRTVQLNVRISAVLKDQLDDLVAVWPGRRTRIRDVIEELIKAEYGRRVGRDSAADGGEAGASDQ